MLRDKQEIRKRLSLLRDSIPIEVRTQKDAAIRHSLFNIREVLYAKRILTYVSFRSEVDTRRIISDFMSLNIDIVVPRVMMSSGGLLAYLIKDIDELSPGFCGILEPIDDKIFNGKRQVKETDIDVCITPGLAFDEEKNRLGYGKGYYDRYLRHIKLQRADRFTIIGIAYEEQMLKSIPHTAEDIKMDIIVTDKRVIR